MNAAQLYEEALAQATEVVSHVTAADYDSPTPDTEWDVHDLANHMLNELCWTADIVEGRTMAEVGEKYDGDLIGADNNRLQDSWRTAADAAHHAIEAADLQDTAHVSYDDITVEEYLCQAAADQLIHAWDLAEAIDVTIEFDRTLAEAVYAYLLPQKNHLSETGLFAKPVSVAEDAPLQVKLLALTGRQSSS
jgi:uncharacterized protein (TIGR03086 family)